MTYKYLKHNKLESIIYRHAEDGMQTQVGSVHADQSIWVHMSIAYVDLEGLVSLVSPTPSSLLLLYYSNSPMGCLNSEGTLFYFNIRNEENVEK